jgi:hypothetical protein
MSLTTLCKPDTAADVTKPAGNNITDKRGFGGRWGFSTRHVDNLIAQGLPHLKIGKRRVRILIDEGDAWMKEKFSTRRS